jgi:hypothetical protein
MDLSPMHDHEVLESLSDIIGQLEDCDEDYRVVNVDEAQDMVKELLKRDTAKTKVFKEMCSVLAEKCGCPAEVDMKLDVNDKDTLQCNRNRCIKTKRDDKTNTCWNIYFFRRTKEWSRI